MMKFVVDRTPPCSKVSNAQNLGRGRVFLLLIAYSHGILLDMLISNGAATTTFVVDRKTTS